MRISKTFAIADTDEFRKKLSVYADTFDVFALPDSCGNTVYGSTTFDYALAAGVRHILVAQSGNAFEQLKQFRATYPDFCFGYFGYDLKNETEVLFSKNFDGMDWPDMVFFIPEIYLEVKGSACTIFLFEDNNLQHESIFTAIQSTTYIEKPSAVTPLQQRIPAERYLQKVRDIKHHIAEGDIYELNFCQEFYSSGNLDAVSVYNNLCEKSKAPFSVLFKWENRYLISASPERFLKKQGSKVMSQPIKGTHQRSADAALDEQYKNNLFHSIKDRAENVMIVDLVRNDLAKYAKTGTIKVDELFGIYSFQQVHQMVSTISADLKDGVDGVDVIRSAFPMGSMTGAPKVMAMQLIEQYEATKRGLFSGAFGYFTPSGDFDFNVIIRSIQYHATTKYISIQTGGAIVYDSVAEDELEECYLKLRALRSVIFSRI